jgi:hypothetical protein
MEPMTRADSSLAGVRGEIVTCLSGRHIDAPPAERVAMSNEEFTDAPAADTLEKV